MAADPTSEDSGSSPTPLPCSGLNFTDPNSPLSPYFFSAAQVVAVGLLAAIFLFYSLLPPLFHTDFWGHLKYGQWIAAHRSLPQREPFSAFSDAEQPFVDFAWLSQLSYYAVFEFGGWLAGGDEIRQLAASVDMTRASHGIAVLLRFVFLFFAMRARNGSAALACAGIVLALAGSATYCMIQRPQVMGELCFAALLAAASAPTLRPWKLIGIPLLIALWANLHGSFLVGLLFLGLSALGTALDAAHTSSGWQWREAWRDVRARQLAMTFAVSVAAACLNPYGIRLYGHVLDLAAHPNVLQMAEWQPIFSSPSMGSPYMYLVLLLFAAISQLATRQPPTITWGLYMVSFGVAPLFQQRHYTWWVMIAAWLIVPQWRWLEERIVQHWPPLRSVPSLRKTLLAFGLVVLATVWSSPVQLLVGQPPLPLTLTVSRATPYFLESRIGEAFDSRRASDARDDSIWTSETLADYLLWKLDVPERLFVYSHVHVFPEAHWQEHTTVLFGRPGWSRILDRHRVHWVMVEPEIRPELVEALRRHADWQILIDETGDSSKRDPRERLLVARRRETRR